jgi:hypothetical protein
MDLESGHFSFPGALIAQPKLQGLTVRIPDFMWIATTSDTILPVLIEIECPSKGWFTNKGQPTAYLTQARTQLAGWRSWFRKDVNQRWFQTFYQLPEEMLRRKVVRPAFVLIYGRRSEFEERADLNQLRAELPGEREFYMTFDRLSPDSHAAHYVTCRKPDPDGYNVVSVPPTFEWGPILMPDRLLYRGLKSSFSSSEWTTDERRAFLIARHDYWMEWGRNGARGLIRGGDRE